MTLRRIDAFRAVMLTGTATEAARMLGITQPAVSRLNADLEAEFDMKLFDRVGRRVIPTVEAKILFEEVRRAFFGLDRIKDTALAIRNYRYSRLRIVTLPSVAATIAVDIIRVFSERHPSTFVSLEVEPSDSAVEWIISQQCDLGLASPPKENPAISARTVASGPSVCLLPAGHRLAQEPLVVPEMLAGESFISFRPDSIYRFKVDEIFKQAGVERVMKFEARTTDAVCGLVAQGLGVAVVGPFLPRSVEADGLVLRPFERAPQVELSLLWSAQRPMSAIARTFVEVIDDYFSAPRP